MLVHLVELQGAGPVVARRLAHRRAGQRRDEDLRLDPGGHDLGGLGDLGRQHAVLDQEDVAVELRPLVAGPDLFDHAEHLDPLAVGEDAVGGDHVVELQVLVVGDGHPVLERGCVLGADDTADRAGNGCWCGFGHLVRR